jgi:hypothetical protein
VAFWDEKRNKSEITLLAAAAVSANGNSAPAVLGDVWTDVFGMINVSAVPAGGTPTLDVYIQTSPDGGTSWKDIVHTQFTTSALKRFFQIAGGAAGSTAILAASDAALAGETVVQGPWGDLLRVKWIFAAGGSTGAYTLAVQVVTKGGSIP